MMKITKVTQVPSVPVWVTPPEMRGQTVEVSFGTSDDNYDDYIYTKRLDQSDNSVEYYRQEATEDDDLEFHNGPPSGW